MAGSTRRCPTCLAVLDPWTVIWRDPSGAVSAGPPRRPSTLDRLRAMLDRTPDRRAQEWADWYARGFRAYCPDESVPAAGGLLHPGHGPDRSGRRVGFQQDALHGGPAQPAEPGGAVGVRRDRRLRSQHRDPLPERVLPAAVRGAAGDRRDAAPGVDRREGGASGDEGADDRGPAQLADRQRRQRLHLRRRGRAAAHPSGPGDLVAAPVHRGRCHVLRRPLGAAGGPQPAGRPRRRRPDTACHRVRHRGDLGPGPDGAEPAARRRPVGRAVRPAAEPRPTCCPGPRASPRRRSSRSTISARPPTGWRTGSSRTPTSWRST